MGLHLLLDSAEPEDWYRFSDYGIFHGITTNPTLLKAASQTCSATNITLLTQKAEELGYKEIHLQAWGKTEEDILKCAIELSKIKVNTIKIYVKLPLTEIAIKAAKYLISDNVSITFTACFEIKQVLIAAALGASYIAPYLGRINDENREGISVVSDMQMTLEGLRSSSKLLIASIRDIQNIIILSQKGINTFTINTSIAKSILSVHSTIRSNNQFEEDVKNNR